MELDRDPPGAGAALAALAALVARGGAAPALPDVQRAAAGPAPTLAAKLALAAAKGRRAAPHRHHHDKPPHRRRSVLRPGETLPGMKQRRITVQLRRAVPAGPATDAGTFELDYSTIDAVGQAARDEAALRLREEARTLMVNFGPDPKSPPGASWKRVLVTAPAPRA